MTIETKIAKNGATLYYVDGKRVSREKAKLIRNEQINATNAADYAKLEGLFGEVDPAKEETNALVALNVVPQIEGDIATYRRRKSIDEALAIAAEACKIFGHRLKGQVLKVNPDNHNDSEVVAVIEHGILTKFTMTKFTNNNKIAAIEAEIKSVVDERTDAYDELEAAEANDEISQETIDRINEDIEDISNQYWQLVDELEAAKAEPEDEPPTPDTDGSEDTDVFNLLPEIDELNDVDDIAPVIQPLRQTFTFTPNGNEWHQIFTENDVVSFFNGKLNHISSTKYAAWFSVPSCHYAWHTFKDGKLYGSKGTNDEEEFFAEMEKRGACSIDIIAPETDIVTYRDGKLDWVSSPKYGASFNPSTGQYVVRHFECGKTSGKVVHTDYTSDPEKFFAEMEKRGACSFGEPAQMTDATFEQLLGSRKPIDVIIKEDPQTREEYYDVEGQRLSEEQFAAAMIHNEYVEILNTVEFYREHHGLTLAQAEQIYIYNLDEDNIVEGHVDQMIAQFKAENNPDPEDAEQAKTG